jgi:hypothetical protein
VVVAETLAGGFGVGAGRARLAGVVAEDAAVVGLLAGDQAEPVPAFDAAGMGVKACGDLAEGEQPAIEQPLVVAGHLVVVRQFGDAVAVPGVLVAAGMACGVQLGGDLGVGAAVEQVVDQFGDLAWGLAALPGVLRDGQADDVVAAAGEADGGSDGVVASGQGDVGDQEADQPLAYRGFPAPPGQR